MSSPQRAAFLAEGRRWFAGTLRAHAAAVRIAGRSVWPVFDLLLRIWLAQSFLSSAVVQMMHAGPPWAPPPGGFAALMGPLVHSGWGRTLEFGSATALAGGFLTQLAALTLLLVALATTATPTSDAQLLIYALLGWYGLGGAGPLSLDWALGGLASSALTLAKPALRAADWLRSVIVPLYQLALRAWIAIALALGSAGGALALGGALFPRGLAPGDSAPHLGPVLSLTASVFLLTGTATRYVAVALFLLMSFSVMMDPEHAAHFYWILALTLIVLRGPGSWSVDALIERGLRRSYPELDGKPAFSLEGLPRVVIVGAGFGGLTCAKALCDARVAVTLIDRANHHLFQPLLYQVATASLSPGDIAAPIRPLFRDAFNVNILCATVTGVDSQRRLVEAGATQVPYDYLVLASGATHGYFGKDEWQGFAPGLKRLEDATEIRRRVLTAFEKAELTQDEAERCALLTFLVVGGGPTGVELAGALAELARLGMHKDFRHFDPAAARVVLVQSAPRLLPSFPEALSTIAQRSLEQLGVEVHTGRRVEMIDAAGVSVSGERIPARTVLWAAGVVASAAARWLGTASDRAGRVIVEPDLSVRGFSNVFAIGDTAACMGWSGREVPGLAPAAKQGGSYVAHAIRARTMGRPAAGPFQYRHRGSLATIGRKSAVADFGAIRLWGPAAWWLWGVVHVGLLVGVRNRIATMVNWFWSYLTFKSAIRLITGDDVSGQEAPGRRRPDVRVSGHPEEGRPEPERMGEK